MKTLTHPIVFQYESIYDSDDFRYMGDVIIEYYEEWEENGNNALRSMTTNDFCNWLIECDIELSDGKWFTSIATREDQMLLSECILEYIKEKLG